jgi:hypothetical protein
MTREPGETLGVKRLSGDRDERQRNKREHKGTCIKYRRESREPESDGHTLLIFMTRDTSGQTGARDV